MIFVLIPSYLKIPAAKTATSYVKYIDTEESLRKHGIINTDLMHAEWSQSEHGTCKESLKNHINC